MQRRLAGEPLQYIRRTADFFGREFYVDDRVLIPRPETELLVEAVIELAPRGARVVDIGTGSGCVAASIAAARPDLQVFAVDVSIGALAVASRNGARRLAASDLLSSFRKPFDVIVSNPPYIALAEVEKLMTEVRDHEPHLALTPGPKGTEVIERILQSVILGAAEREESPSHVRGGSFAVSAARDDTLVLLEIGFGQKDGVTSLARSHGFTVEEVRDDLAGIPRVVVLSRHG